jgi:uncharacterized membrane protein
MKKFILISTMVLSTTTFAATSGTLLLQGVVAQKLSIAVTPAAAATALDLSTSQTNLTVASVNEKSNSKTGYKVTITSANAGNLKRTDGADVFAYSMKYGGSAVGLSGVGTTFSQATSGSVNVNKDISISYTGIAAEAMVEGTYADTLTLNIAAN